MPGILRSKKRKDGTKNYFYRYPTTNLLKGTYCPLCLLEIPEGRQEIHHIVPASTTLHEIGRVVNHHRNLIHICAVCHKKITHGSNDEITILDKRIEYFMESLYGLFYFSKRNALKNYINERPRITSMLEEKPRDILDFIRKTNAVVKRLGVSHYRASFEELYFKDLCSERFYFLDNIDIYIFSKNPHYAFGE